MNGYAEAEWEVKNACSLRRSPCIHNRTGRTPMLNRHLMEGVTHGDTLVGLCWRLSGSKTKSRSLRRSISPCHAEPKHRRRDVPDRCGMRTDYIGHPIAVAA